MWHVLPICSGHIAFSVATERCCGPPLHACWEATLLCGNEQVLSAAEGGGALTAWSVVRSLYQREGARPRPLLQLLATRASLAALLSHSCVLSCTPGLSLGASAGLCR